MQTHAHTHKKCLQKALFFCSPHWLTTLDLLISKLLHFPSRSAPLWFRVALLQSRQQVSSHSQIGCGWCAGTETCAAYTHHTSPTLVADELSSRGSRPLLSLQAETLTAERLKVFFFCYVNKQDHKTAWIRQKYKNKLGMSKNQKGDGRMWKLQVFVGRWLRLDLCFSSAHVCLCQVERERWRERERELEREDRNVGRDRQKKRDARQTDRQTDGETTSVFSQKRSKKNSLHVLFLQQWIFSLTWILILEYFCDGFTHWLTLPSFHHCLDISRALKYVIKCISMNRLLYLLNFSVKKKPFQKGSDKDISLLLLLLMYIKFTFFPVKLNNNPGKRVMVLLLHWCLEWKSSIENIILIWDSWHWTVQLE